MRLILILMLLLYAGKGFSQTTCDTKNSYTIFYGNGVNNTRTQAAKNRTRLEAVVGFSFSGQPLHTRLAYNQTDGLIADLYESARQEVGEYKSNFFLWLSKAARAPASFNVKVQGLLSIFALQKFPDLGNSTGIFREALHNGERVLIVSHSQGNFYANEAKRVLGLTDAPFMRSFGILGIATPASNVGGNRGPYYTNDRDFISHVLPDTLPANWTLRRTSDQSLAELDIISAHDFADVYLSSSFNALPAIVQQIGAVLEGLDDPIPECVTLPVIPQAGQPSYLPALFAGEIAINSNAVCVETSTLRIGTDGSITGSGCYDGVAFPAGSSYSYSFSPSTPSLSPTLSISLGPIGAPRRIFFAQSADSPTTTVGVFFPPLFPPSPFGASIAPMIFNPLTRVLSGVSYMSGRPCTARIRGDLIEGSSYIEIVDGTILLRQGATIQASAALAELASQPLNYLESYGTLADQPEQLGMGASRSGGSSREFTQLSVGFLRKGDPTVFRFNASFMQLQDGSRASVSCDAN